MPNDELASIQMPAHRCTVSSVTTFEGSFIGQLLCPDVTRARHVMICLVVFNLGFIVHS
jgi:hypothetical protein